MTATDRRARLAAAFDSMAAGDAAAFLAMIAPEVAYRVIGTTQFSGLFQGKDVVLEQLFAPLTAALTGPLRLEPEQMIADDAHVVVQAHGHAALRSGARYDNTYCFVFRFDREQIVAITEYLDTALVTRAFGVPDTRGELLRRMDLNMWAMFAEMTRLCRGGALRQTARYTLCYSPRGTPFHNMVMVEDGAAVDEVLAAAADFFGASSRIYSVWTREHADEAFETTLRQRGFSERLRMPGMALLADPGTRCAPPGLEVRPVTEERTRHDFQAVCAAAYATYGSPPDYTRDAFATLDSLCAPHIQGFVGYAADTPAATAALYLTHGVAGIAWVGTMPEYRNRGFGEAVTWATVREGLRRGACFANLQASPMGRPIYERMGFVTPTSYRVLVPQR